jgi:hypothetical protein
MTETDEAVLDEEIEEMEEAESSNKETTEGGLAGDYGVNLVMHEGRFDPNRVKFLVYSESGVGKTVFASTFPKCIFLDIDKGMASVKRQVHRIPIEDWTDVQNASMFLAYGDHDFETVVIDSLNELQWISMRHVIEDYPSIRRSYDSLPAQADYGKMLDDFDKFVRFIRGLPMNVVFIANVAPQEFETDIIQPQFTGKATAGNIARKMDCIGYLFKVDGNDPKRTRVMSFDDSKHVTKDRSDKLPSTIQNPTYPVLYQYWSDED